MTVNIYQQLHLVSYNLKTCYLVRRQAENSNKVLKKIHTQSTGGKKHMSNEILDSRVTKCL